MAQVARTNTTVLIRGESGTGKEMVAHAIHYNSPRAKKPFIKVNCAALPETLIESELFGYDKGAFTGAQGAKKGRFELAEGGTLFLDEIGEVASRRRSSCCACCRSASSSASAARVHRIDVRLIAATHRARELIERGSSGGPFYRLDVFTIFAPPLRERKPDIPLLADTSSRSITRARQGRPARLDAGDRHAHGYHWPGNVRELENTIERAVLVCDSDVIHAHHLPPTLQTAEARTRWCGNPHRAWWHSSAT